MLPGSSASKPAAVLPLCYQLNDALSIALDGDLSSLTVLRRHLQLEQFHTRRQLELELLDYEQETGSGDGARDGVVDGDRGASLAQSEARAEELARHDELRRQHAQAAAALSAQLQSKLQQAASPAPPAAAAHSANSTGSAGAADARIAAAALPDLRFLPQCLISRLDPSLFSSPDLPQPQLPTVTPASPQPLASSHLHHLGHAAHQPADTAAKPHAGAGTHGPAGPYPPTETPSRPLVSLMVQYFNRPWMLPVLAAPFRRCSSLHAATTPPNATSFSSGEEEIARTRHLGFGIEMLINVDSRTDAAAVAEFAAGPLGAGGFVVPVYSNNVHEIRSYNRLARLARGKILVMLQDDDVFPEESACMWLSDVVRAFARWPRLGAVGSQRYVFNYHPNSTDWFVHYWDAGAGHVRVRPPPPHLLQEEGQEEGDQGQEQGQEEQGQEQAESQAGREGDATAVGAARRRSSDRRASRRLHAQTLQWQEVRGAAAADAPDQLRDQHQHRQQPEGQQRRLRLQQEQEREREVLEQEARLAAGQPRWRAPAGVSWDDVPAASLHASPSTSSLLQRQRQSRLRRLWLRLHRRSVLQEAAGGGAAAGADAHTDPDPDPEQAGAQDQGPAAPPPPAPLQDGVQPDGPPPYEPPYIPLASYDGRLRMQFVSIIDYAPISVRRSAFLAVGGIDENMSEGGACGVHSDYDLTLRLWMAGWQVAYVEVPGLGKDPAESEGGTHRKGVSGYCWERQWDQAIGYMRARWGQHNRWDPQSYYWFGSNTFEVVAEHVRLLNLQLLQPLAQPPGSYCPFGYGCDLEPRDNITGTPQQVHPPFGELSSWPKHMRVQAPWAPGWAAAQAQAQAAEGQHARAGGQGHARGPHTQRRSSRLLRRRQRRQQLGHRAHAADAGAGAGAGAGDSSGGVGVQVPGLGRRGADSREA
ncbi:hypothetical protein HXX76_009542 [Chlamydomonas incerta]|uniref:Uncharacterized protein n=1 Tax=Chlamydomonas incerta TaxID=51695 RepID=A0A835SQV9_CHLIN|nr:hypothetical protein HXX76_009542 [Chlamydomonas incerta]|eukprot:KAG2431528.1 hypothetical protein HXX76_009542 [Chlamydomonas incerta]